MSSCIKGAAVQVRKAWPRALAAEALYCGKPRSIDGSELNSLLLFSLGKLLNVVICCS